jgi:WD40 repeat protein
MKRTITFGFNLILFCLALHENFVSCDILAKQNGYTQTCESTECQNAISLCVKKWNCLGLMQCKDCLANYPKCESACETELFNEDNYIAIYGIKYLPCNQTSLEQVAACELQCRGRNFLNSQCTSIDGLSACKCSSHIPLQMSSSQTTNPPTSTTWNNIILKGHSNYVRCLVVLNNGDLASGSFDKSIIIWDTITYSKK